MPKFGFTTITVLAITIGATTSYASGGGSEAAGAQIAENLCSRCHDIADVGPSPVADAPGFRNIARQWPPDHLREAFAEGIMVGHGPVEMPSFELGPDQIDDLIAYLNRLAKP